MPLLQVRDCPEDVYQKLRLQAERDNRSVPQETVVLLRDALQIRDARHYERQFDDLYGRIQAFNARHSEATASDIDWATMIREDRER